MGKGDAVVGGESNKEERGGREMKWMGGRYGICFFFVENLMLTCR